MPLSGNLGNCLQSSHFPVSSTMMIQPVSHYTSCKYIARTFSCAEPGSATIPSLLLTHHTTVSSTNESNLPRSIWGEGGKGFFTRQQKKITRETNQQKITPKQRLPTLTFAAWLRSDTLHPPAPHIPPGWSHFLQLAVRMSSPGTEPAAAPWHQLHLAPCRKALLLKQWAKKPRNVWGENERLPRWQEGSTWTAPEGVWRSRSPFYKKMVNINAAPLTQKIKISPSLQQLSGTLQGFSWSEWTPFSPSDATATKVSALASGIYLPLSRKMHLKVRLRDFQPFHWCLSLPT